MTMKEWVFKHRRVWCVLFLALAGLNVWSGLALLHAHPILGVGNLATAAILVWAVILTWPMREAP